MAPATATGGLAGTAAAAGIAQQRFRLRAGPELVALADLGVVSNASAALGGRLQAMAEEELRAAFGEPTGAEAEAAPPATAAGAPTDAAARAACVEGIRRDTDAALAIARTLEEHHQEVRKLKTARADILAVGFQTTTAENQEFASLVVCATAGIFAVSLHWSFFSIWIFAYLLYRRSTKQVRIQRAATDDLGTVVERLRELEELEKARVEEFRSLAASWRGPE